MFGRREIVIISLLVGLLFGPVAQAAQQKVKGIRLAVVVIDPGHGGKDPGAIGVGGVYEKTIVLNIARYLRHYIDDAPGMMAYLTRNRDRFIPLEKRLAFARSKHADLFVAIHADAYKNKNARGASVYRLSELGASNEKARWLSSQTDTQSYLNRVKLSNKNYILRSVLIDLAQTRTEQMSTALGKDVLNQLGKTTQLNDNTAQSARFVVLRAPDVPSVLVETGFISNPVEAKLLQLKTFQKQLAGAIFDGIQQFLMTHPPKNSLFAHGKRVSVKPRDTLSGIAYRYHMTVSELKKINKLKSDVIHPNQLLYVI